MKRQILVIMLCGLWPLLSFSQQKGTLEVHQDSLITALQQYRANQAEHRGSFRGLSGGQQDRSQLTRSVVRGYRVQVYLGPSRSEAYAEQERFQRMFKHIDTYIQYEEPNYRVKVGDFQHRSEAESLMQSLRSIFSNVFVFTEDIVIYQ